MCIIGETKQTPTYSVSQVVYNFILSIGLQVFAALELQEVNIHNSQRVSESCWTFFPAAAEYLLVKRQFMQFSKTTPLVVPYPLSKHTSSSPDVPPKTFPHWNAHGDEDKICRALLVVARVMRRNRPCETRKGCILQTREPIRKSDPVCP